MPKTLKLKLKHRTKHMKSMKTMMRCTSIINGGSGRGASGASLKSQFKLKPFDTAKLIGLISYYEAFKRIKLYPPSKMTDDIRMKMANGEISLELRNSKLWFILNNEKAQEIDILLAKRAKESQGKQPDDYINGDANLVEKLGLIETDLKDFVRSNPYFKNVGKAVNLQELSPVATNELGATLPKKKSTKSPPKRHEKYFELAQLFLDTFAAFEKLQRNPRELYPDQREFTQEQIHAFRPSIMNEIDKLDIENKIFIIENPNPRYDTQIALESQLINGIGRLLALIAKYKD